MVLCNICSKIIVRKIYDANNFKHVPDFRQLLYPNIKCDLCTLLAKRCIELADEVELHNCTQLVLAGNSLGSGNGRIFPMVTNGSFWYGLTDDLHPGIILRVANDADSQFIHNELGLRPYRRLFTSPSSPEAFEWLRRSIEDCTHTHDACNKDFSGKELDGQDPILPTRVVDVGLSGSSQPPRLLETHQQRGRYVALSHCWGQEHQLAITTTTENLENHRRGIPLDVNSKTFQDAFRIAREIGVRYVWIDSLCIIQDDDDDWERESRNMGHIYQNSYTTVCACAAGHAAEGCFAPRKKFQEIEIPFSEDEHKRIQGPYFYLTESANALGDVVEDAYSVLHLKQPDLGPLRTRAWITQEWALSPRLVQFRRGPLIWMCRTKAVREDGRPVEDVHIRGPDDHSSRSAGKRCYEGWRNIVEEHCRRHLSRERDKLDAIQGLISQTENCTDIGDQCTFGLWRKRIVAELGWLRDDTPLRRPDPLQQRGIPSWSWASTVGPVKYFPPIDFDCEEDHTKPLDVKPVDPRDGLLRLRACWKTVEEVGRIGDNYTVLVNESRSELSLFLDDGKDYDGTQPITLLSLGVSIPLPEKWKDIKGVQYAKMIRRRVFLILKPVDGEKFYERVGAGVQNWSDEPLFEDTKRREFSIR